MWRWLFNFTSAASLALFIAVVALLVRSYWRSDNVSTILPDGVRSYLISTGKGGLMVQVFRRSSSEDAHGFRFDRFQWQSGPATSVGGGNHLPEFWRRRGFTFNRPGPMETPDGLIHRVFSMPLWFPASFCAIMPLAWGVAWRKRTRVRQRRAAGLCERCGYDLRASDERCPECGHSIPATVANRPIGVA